MREIEGCVCTRNLLYGSDLCYHGDSLIQNLQSRPLDWGPKEPDVVPGSRPSTVEPERSIVLRSIKSEDGP